MDAVESYQLLGQLLNDLPVELLGTDNLGPDHHRWLGRSLALAKPYLSSIEFIELSSAATHLSGLLKVSNG